MGDFKYQDGLVHFVFANRDTYFLESMVRLSLEDKLYRELSMQGCRRIFYLKRGIHPCVLGTKDRASYEFCALAARKKALFGFRKGTEIPDYSGQDVVRSDEELRAMLRDARNSALVIRIEHFTKLFSAAPEELAALAAENSQNRNVIVVVASVRAADSLPFFRDPQGIFRNERIFPEICQAFSDAHCREGRSYELLRVYLGNRCLFYNSLSRYSIANTVRWVLWNAHKTREENIDEDTEKIAAFVYTWYHSAALRRKYPECLSANEERRYGELSRTLERRLAVILRDLENFREEAYPLETENIDYILGDSPVYAQLKSVRLSPDTREYERWEKLVRAYAKPRGGLVPEEIFRVLRLAAEFMVRAARENDRETFGCCAACLEYGIRTGFETDAETAHLWELRKNCIEVSARRFDMERRIAEKKERILEWRAEWSRQVAEIDRKRRSRVPESELHYEKELALDLDAKIGSYKKVLHDDQRESATFRRLQNQMDVMISSEKLYREQDAEKLEDLLAVSRNAISRYMREKAQENQRIQQVQYDLDDLISGKAEDSVATRFDNMVGRVERDGVESEASMAAEENPEPETAAEAKPVWAEEPASAAEPSTAAEAKPAWAEEPARTEESASAAKPVWAEETASAAEPSTAEEKNPNIADIEEDYPEYELPDDLTEMLY